MAPSGVSSGMVFAAVTPASWGARNASLRSFEGGGCPASPAASVRYPLQAEGLSGEFQPRCYSVMNGKAFDASRDHVGPGRDGGYAAHHQLDGRPLVRGANSIAELPVFPASVNARVGEQVG